jgi:hypothetical protein
MATFAAETMRALRETKEVGIRTDRHPENAVTIWVVVADKDVFIRSVKGVKGQWYKDLAKGGPATLDVAGRAVPVQAVPANEGQSIERASRAYLSKYHDSPWSQSMVRDEVLATTLRLDPR